jgi:predicted Zn-dependent protease
MPDHLRIGLETGGVRKWPFHEIRQAQGGEPGEPARLELGGEYCEAVVVADQEFLTALREKTGGRRFHRALPGGKWAMAVAGAFVAVVALGAAFYAWGIPFIAARIGERVPVEWERALGKSVVNVLASGDKRCGNEELDRVIQSMTRTLVKGLDNCPYEMTVVVSRMDIANAFAAPGGYIVLCQGLIKESTSPEEVAGVIAHEMQHVICRHSTKRLIAQASTGLLTAAMAGDVTGISALSIDSARTLGVLRYSRRDEAEADRKGFELLTRTKVDPDGMIGFYERIAEKTGRKLDKFEVIMTHPVPRARVVELRKLAGKAKGPKEKLLPDVNWERVKNLCSKD